jgi:F-type H+-transporting ATPase subunit a
MKSRIPKIVLRLTLILFIANALNVSVLQAQDGHEGHDEHADHKENMHSGADADGGGHGGDVPISQVIIHHVMDSHDWEFFEVDGKHISLPLPWILYDSEKGLQFFMTKEAMVASGDYVEHHGKVEPTNHAASVYDLSMTKTGLQILLVAIFMLILFTSVAKAYKKRDGMAPKGLQSFMEPLILFVRDDVAKPYLHGKHDKFVPYLLTLFFFIWISNLFGLTPLSSNIAGNTTITLMLALITFILIIVNSTKDFWMHILWFPGVPLPMKPLMFVVELMGFFTKPAALAIRLFANISAGHFMVLSLISLIFILGKNGESIGGAVGIMPLSLAFSLFIFAVELIVAAVQAFVFALLTAVFIGQAMETHDHHEEHDDEHHKAHAPVH